jgi:hypothetical protein
MIAEHARGRHADPSPHRTPRDHSSQKNPPSRSACSSAMRTCAASSISSMLTSENPRVVASQRDLVKSECRVLSARDRRKIRRLVLLRQSGAGDPGLGCYSPSSGSPTASG